MSTKLEGKKHIVEGYVGNKGIVVQVALGESVYVYNVKDSVISIKGKVAAVSIDKAIKSAVVWESCIGSVEIVNCASIQLQGSAPSYALDKTSGATLFLSKKDAAECQVFTSLADSVNVTVLPDGDADPVETPLPSQYVSVFKGGKWHTEPVAHVGV